MHDFEAFLSLLLVAMAIAVIAKRFDFPYPIALLLGGIGVASIPGMPHFRLDPQVVFFVLLPPILGEAAYFTSWRDFWRWRRAVFLLAFGLVTVTSAVVAAICVTLIPGMTWAAGFLLGAIVSPPDAAAATAIMRHLPLSKRIVQILEGESLVNDAAALTVYRFAIAAVATGAFSFQEAALSFLWISVGGVAIGGALGLFLVKIFPTFGDPQVEILSTFLVSYCSYVVAETVHASGVLAVVTAGLIVGWNSPRLFNAITRIRGTAVWQTAIFLVNATVFLAIGLQLPDVLQALQQYDPQELAIWAAAVAMAVMLTRIVWVFPTTYLPRMLSKKIREREPHPSWRAVSVVAWTGLRGVVSLAAAQAVPLMAGDAPFPHRDLMLFLTVVVILATLVLQGLTLRPLIRLLRLPSDHSAAHEHVMARLHATERAMQRLAALEARAAASPAVLARVRGYYEDRIAAIKEEAEAMKTGGTPAPAAHSHSAAEQRVWLELAAAEREVLMELRRSRHIGDEAMRKVEHDIDLLEARMSATASGH
jgi:CPA1 family monovalent cation:H+ antiporter